LGRSQLCVNNHHSFSFKHEKSIQAIIYQYQQSLPNPDKNINQTRKNKKRHEKKRNNFKLSVCFFEKLSYTLINTRVKRSGICGLICLD